MDLLQKLSNAPADLFDYVVDCEHEGYIPSADDMLDELGERYTEWRNLFPDSRHELLGEVEEEHFDIRPPTYLEREYKQRGLIGLRDFV